MRINLILLAILIFAGCASGPVIGTHPASSKPTLLESSSPVKPGWIDKVPPQTQNFLYFVGEGKDIRQEAAEENAKLAMLRDYAFYLGADIRVLENVHREEIKKVQDEVYRTQGKVITKVDALVRIYSTGCRFVERYWEKWSRDNETAYYRYCVLGEVSKESAEEERERVKASKGYNNITEDFSNSDLTAELRTDKDKYSAGDTVLVFFKANDNCYAYLLDIYEKGKVDKIIDSYKIKGNAEHKLISIARYAGTEIVEILKLIVADKPLNMDTAISRIYPESIIDDLRAQADSLKARYAERSKRIMIEPR